MKFPMAVSGHFISCDGMALRLKCQSEELRNERLETTGWMHDSEEEE